MNSKYRKNKKEENVLNFYNNLTALVNIILTHIRSSVEKIKYNMFLYILLFSPSLLNNRINVYFPLYPID